MPCEDADDVGEDRVASLPGWGAGRFASAGWDVAVKVCVACELRRERVSRNGRAVQLQEPVLERQLVRWAEREISEQRVSDQQLAASAPRQRA